MNKRYAVFSCIFRYNEPIWKIWKHKRYIISILAFFGFMNVYALRTNLNIAIVDITAYKNITLEDGTTILVNIDSYLLVK